jgi:hypothetical protein
MRFLLECGKAAGLGLLCATLIMVPVACNPTTAVNAIGAVANTFLSNCGTFTSTPQDLAACTAINLAVQASVSEFDAAYNAYIAAKGNTASNLAALEAAITAALKNLPAALTQFRIVDPNSQNKILGMIELIVSAFELIAGFFGVAVPAALSARMNGVDHPLRVQLGVTVRKGSRRDLNSGIKELKSAWNSGICGGLSGAQLKGCLVN